MDDTVILTVSTADVTMFTAIFSNLRNDTNTVTAVNRAGAGMPTTKLNIILRSPSMTQHNPTSMCIYRYVLLSKHDTIRK